MKWKFKQMHIVVLFILLSPLIAHAEDNTLPIEIQRYLGFHCKGVVSSTASFDNYIFTLTTSPDNTNYLCGFRLDDSGWTNWLDSSEIVFQNVAEGRVFVTNITGMTTRHNGTYAAPTLGIILSNNGSHVKQLAFTLDNDQWLLSSYWSHGCGEYYDIVFVEETVTYYESVEARKAEGSVSDAFQREIGSVDILSIPTTLEEAQLQLSPNILPYDVPELIGFPFDFEKGQRYAVYSAPNVDSYRGANGKAEVSTNDWIRVYGEENGWLLIMYSINASHYRFGYILPQEFKQAQNIVPLTIQPVYYEISYPVSITDDPFHSQEEIIRLPTGYTVSLIAVLDSWAYVEVEMNQVVRGFIPIDSLSVKSR